MPAIGSPDVAIIRQGRYRIPLDSFVINLPPLIELATAEIETTPTSYPAYDYAITNTSANWSDVGVAIESQLVRIFDGTTGKLKYEGILRRNATADTLRLPAHNAGDTGNARQFAQVIVAGDNVVIYDTRRPGSQLSYLDPVTEEQYKRYDDVWVDQTIEPKPQPNMGTHQHQRVSGGVGTFSLDGSNSFSFNGNALDYEWELPLGVSVVSGTVNDPTLTVEADPGAHQIALRVEDSVTGKQKRGYRWLYATDGKNGDYPALSDTYAPVRVEEEHTQLGRNMTFTFLVDRTNTDLVNRLYLGAQLYACWNREFTETADEWRTRETPSTGLINEYTGYIRSYDYEITSRGAKRVTVRCENPMQYFGGLPIAAQLIKESAAPASWQEVAVDLNNLAYYVYYVLEHHAPSILQLSDFDYGDFDTLRMFGVNIPAGSVLNAAQFVVNSRPGANIGCTSSGTIKMRRHPWVESESYRDAVPVVWSFTSDDVKERIGFSLNPIMRNGLTYGAGLVWGAGNTTAGYKAWTGGFAMAQGVNRATMQDFTASSEAEVLSLVGHWHQMSNSPVEYIDLDILQSRDVFEPVDMEVFELSLSDYDPTDADIPAEVFTETQRAICTTIKRTWSVEQNTLVVRLTATFQPETSGMPAMIVPELERGEGLVSLPPAPGVIDCVNWLTVGDTPFGWETVGSIPSTSGWVGTVTGIGGDYTSNRPIGTYWAENNASSPPQAGVMRTFSLPTVVTSLDLTMFAPELINRRVSIVIKRDDDVYEVLLNTVFIAGLGNAITTNSWTGTKTAKEVLFLIISSSSTMQINATCINGD